MALLEIFERYLPSPLGRIIDTYLDAWIDIDRILFFFDQFITYGGYTNSPQIDATEYGLNRVRLGHDQDSGWFDYQRKSWYWQTDKFVVHLPDRQRQKHHIRSLNLYDLSRSPACVGIGAIHFTYRHRTKDGMQIALDSTSTLPEAQDYFSVYDIAKGISVFTDAICRLTETLSDQGGGQIDTFEILECEGDSLTVRIDFPDKCNL